MPYNRPGPGVYVTNGGTPIQHGAPCVINGFVGVAVKQKARLWSDPYSGQATIDAAENFFIITKGVVQVLNTAITANVKGDPIYITAAGALSATSAGNTKFGRIVEVSGSRGTPIGR